MREAAEELNRGRPKRDFILKIGIHRGAAIVVTLNDRLDYFGQSVNIASRVQNLAGGDEICLTEEVRQAPGVEAALAGYPVRVAEAELKGVDQTTPVYFIGAAPPQDAARESLRSRNECVVIHINFSRNRRPLVATSVW